MSQWLAYGDGWFAEFGSVDAADRWQAHLEAAGLEVRRGWSSVLARGPVDTVRAATAHEPAERPDMPTAPPIEVPVIYDGDDLQSLADLLSITVDDVVARHTAAEYRVVMLGFTAGFPYLAGLDPLLHVARRSSPRPRVAAGSVAIAGAQCGIYPTASPGGWHLLGRTTAVVFDARRHPPVLLRPGDTVRFRAVG